MKEKQKNDDIFYIFDQIKVSGLNFKGFNFKGFKHRSALRLEPIVKGCRAQRLGPWGGGGVPGATMVNFQIIQKNFNNLN